MILISGEELQQDSLLNGQIMQVSEQPRLHSFQMTNSFNQVGANEVGTTQEKVCYLWFRAVRVNENFDYPNLTLYKPLPLQSCKSSEKALTF